MPIEKQSLNNFLPDGFETLNQEGYKENFNEDKIKTGYEKDLPDIVSGPNLNNLIDVVGKNTNTLNNYVEYLNGMPINNVPTTDENGQLNYINLDDKLTEKQITNCILEIPQRIKYTLVDGTLTIKAGSVIIVPYGVEDLTAQYPKGATFIHDNFKVYDTQYEDGKFFVWAEFVNDVVKKEEWSSNENRGLFFFDLQGLKTLYTEFGYQTSSGSDFSTTTPYNTRYNITENLIKRAYNTGATWTGVVSLPLLQIIYNSGYKTVEQVFNGFGYIGSTIWVDKGVKGLYPNGRNEDGTLNNIEYTTSNLNLRTFVNKWTNSYYLFFDGSKISVEATNIFDNDLNLTKLGSGIHIGFLRLESDVVTLFSIKKPFRAVDYNDASILGMPSTKYTSLTLGTSGSTYIAPANGWVYVCKTTGQTGITYLRITNLTRRMVAETTSTSGNANTPSIFIPVVKGDKFQVAFNMTGSTKHFEFIYAEGEV